MGGGDGGLMRGQMLKSGVKCEELRVSQWWGGGKGAWSPRGWKLEFSGKAAIQSQEND